MKIITQTTNRAELKIIANEGFGDMIKAVVDLRRSVMAVGAELHVDEEQLLLQNNSHQEDLWGINLYPDVSDDSWLEFDSMINIRPKQNNRTRAVHDPTIQQKIISVVQLLVKDF
ncbi:MAG: hypothetical protein A2821_01370 [Candidatus Magasanikbacteria bacterium RIFCSPHIGHO2_01_FULL_41_23]|uniref:Uncharacterized protein n=1 Tax=Candidatus Magasanikbacteria bacterium RIFCSPLOWO2_01_FULL_40_15 TaxID=1798686 RepID=A0A1F6N586_9BACT|nr:MAG: hypothetical protein A2821_01370 [Candidatus Magasanikbacteria bacterium RIFCSPHIGHO2_01_FULL_41_23]OGH66916.1 MAG: hypothetical protein A3C66_01675 [Candidatus Magasanikbacteria bacterium RIFCSPHIGHO2_02_FULL_41_35]OGH74594.1 MAG: hypothetical protein A3F22_03080 [Candidatus Magasanikbacteria bacterium RIFCSPHIGHO2_12_FULL_41_16]OGH78898.1 MAG: hypothetical protein A2983_00830 [Candidatus Magasanikbacteria bacterium RIFCSPLOWO2_01_FULL_40_15]